MSALLSYSIPKSSLQFDHGQILCALCGCDHVHIATRYRHYLCGTCFTFIFERAHCIGWYSI